MRRLGIAALLWLLLTSCAPTTIIFLTLDFDSFLDDDLKSASFVVPGSSGVAVYVLPGLQIDDIGAGPDDDMRLGLELRVPDLPDESRLRTTIAVGFDLANLSDSETLPAWTLEIVLAPLESADLYTDGITVGSLAIPPLPPETMAPVELRVEIGEGDPGFGALQSGGARVGISLTFTPSPGGPVLASLETKEIQIDVSVRPYSIFRLW